MLLLQEYSHWGYCDLDMVIGNLPLFLEHRELATQDIISYSFGDMDALYLRGQWTVHRNRREVSTIWKVRALARLACVCACERSTFACTREAEPDALVC